MGVKEIFDKLKPMLLSPSPPFNSDDYIFELKLDGFRCLAHLNGQNCRFKSRNGNDLGARFLGLNDLARQTTCECILDGEIVALVNGVPNRGALFSSKCSPIYAVFDILYVDGKNLTLVPQIERKQILLKNIKPCHNLILCSFVETKGEELFNQVKAQSLEGIVAKRKQGVYYPAKRAREWLKIRCDTF